MLDPFRQEMIDHYQPGDWFLAQSPEELKAFYLNCLPRIREAARNAGYAIAVHGSMVRDFDLIAVPWQTPYMRPEFLARQIAIAACGLTRGSVYEWEEKPNGRIATSIPICWYFDPNVVSAGHIDLSVMVPEEAYKYEIRSNPAPLLRLCRTLSDPPPVMSKQITISPICKKLEVSRDTVYRMLDPTAYGYDPSFPKPWFINGRLRFDKAAFDKWFCEKGE